MNAESRNPFKEMNGIRLSFAHIKVFFTAGMGFFTDAYDLFIIGAVLDVFSKASIPGFDIGIKMLGMPLSGFLGASAIFTAIIGQLLFGALADRFGRKSVYGTEATLMAIGALLSAVSPNIYWLIASRLVLGLGIGGDYPVSSVIMSEYANTKDRGKLIALVFSTQGIGSLTAILVGALSASILPPSISWRIMLGIGAIPALSVIYLRRKIPETPRYALLVKRNKAEAEKAAGLLGAKLSGEAVSRDMPLLEFIRRYWLTLLVTAGTWFLIDMAFYGSGVYSGPIVSSFIPISPSLPASVQIERLILEAGLPFIVGLPGYYLAVALMDKLGRKNIQLIGFTGMALLYLIVTSIMETSGTKVIGFLLPASLSLSLYVLTFFFIDFGPNTTTFVIPAEVYPTRYRTRGHGISAAAGKGGAAISTLLVPSLELSIGIHGIMLIYAAAALMGLGLTLLLKEPKQKDLETVAEEEIVPIN